MKLTLTGPMYSGKTTLSRYLADVLGFARYDDSYMLKELACTALGAVGCPTSPEAMIKDKPTYRAFLQEFGVLCGYDSPTEPRGVVETYRRWEADGKPQYAVHETVRTVNQARYLMDRGWTLVRLKVSPDVQLHRARKAGATEFQLATWAMHPVDMGVPHMPGEVVLDADHPVSTLADVLVEVTRDD